MIQRSWQVDPIALFCLAQLRLPLYTERMSSSGSAAPISTASINYESDPVLQVELEGVQYRLDVGMQGTALSISERSVGAWDWSFVGEAKWDRVDLRCKALARPIREALARALRANAEGEVVD